MRRHVLPMFLAALLGTASGTFSSAVAQPASTCVFLVSMTSGVDVNNLDLKVNYLGTGGNVEGTPKKPECTLALGGQSFAAFNDNDDTSVLSSGIVRLNYFSSPTLLFGCRIFYDSIEPVPQDFQVTVTNAGRDSGDNNVVPTPTVIVSSVECPGELPTGTTTTTLPQTTTTTFPLGDRCGFPISNGDTPSASDALFVLKAAVGVAECALCVCDVNDSGEVAAGDALTLLKAAVGAEVELVCPPC